MSPEQGRCPTAHWHAGAAASVYWSAYISTSSKPSFLAATQVLLSTVCYSNMSKYQWQLGLPSVLYAGPCSGVLWHIGGYAGCAGSTVGPAASSTAGSTAGFTAAH